MLNIAKIRIIILYLDKIRRIKMANLPATTDSLAGDFLKSFGRSLKDYAVRDYNLTSFLKSAMIAIADSKDL